MGKKTEADGGPRGAGRPSLPDGQARDIVVQTRVNAAERQTLVQACAAAGITDMSTAIRIAIAQWAARVRRRMGND